MDARRLARTLRYNPNLWLGHVEKALVMLADPELASVAPHGWVRASESVYVRSIRKRWKYYQAKLAKLAEQAGSDPNRA